MKRAKLLTADFTLMANCSLHPLHGTSLYIRDVPINRNRQSVSIGNLLRIGIGIGKK